MENSFLCANYIHCFSGQEEDHCSAVMFVPIHELRLPPVLDLGLDLKAALSLRISVSARQADE